MLRVQTNKNRSNLIILLFSYAMGYIKGKARLRQPLVGVNYKEEEEKKKRRIISLRVNYVQQVHLRTCTHTFHCLRVHQCWGSFYVAAQLKVDSMDGGRSVWQMSFVVGGYWI